MVRIAIPVTENMVSGPGKAAEIYIFEVEETPKLIEKYENPARTANSTPGIYMLKSALDRNVNAFIVSEIGAPGVRFLDGRVKIFISEYSSVDDVLNKYIKNELKEITDPSMAHESHHHHL